MKTQKFHPGIQQALGFTLAEALFGRRRRFSLGASIPEARGLPENS